MKNKYLHAKIKGKGSRDFMTVEHQGMNKHQDGDWLKTEVFFRVMADV